MTPEQRRLRAQIAAHAKQSRMTPDQRRVQAERMRRGFVERFERLVDPDGVLPVAERQRRAASARAAHMARMALRSSQARQRR